MKVAIRLEDQIGVSQKVLTVIASNGWNLVSMEVETGIIYMHLEGVKQTLSQISQALTTISEFLGCDEIDAMPSTLKETHLQALLARIAEPILDIDKTGIVISANESTLKLFGSQKVVGNRLKSLLNITQQEYQRKSGCSISVNVNHQSYIADVSPVYNEGDYQGAVIMLRETKALGRQLAALQNAKPVEDGIESILSQSTAMSAIKDQASRFAQLDLPVLLRGETGTGKELLARAIHQGSNRSQQPFLAINCATLPEHLLESELFGYQAGAFTGASKGGKPGLLELAEGGTVFLDEIAEMSVYLQAKLLRFLENYQFRRVGGTQELNANVRIISATHQDLERNIVEQQFREDLYYRLNVLSISIPALRERIDDLAILIPHFLELAAKQVNLPVPTITHSGYQELAAYPWPGNIRQLQNSLFRLVALANSNVLTETDIKQVLKEFGQSNAQSANVNQLEVSKVEYRDCENWQAAQNKFEQLLLEQLLPEFPTTRSLAKRLGVSHNKIAMKLRKHDLN